MYLIGLDGQYSCTYLRKLMVHSKKWKTWEHVDKPKQVTLENPKLIIYIVNFIVTGVLLSCIHNIVGAVTACHGV